MVCYAGDGINVIVAMQMRVTKALELSAFSSLHV